MTNCSVRQRYQQTHVILPRRLSPLNTIDKKDVIKVVVKIVVHVVASCHKQCKCNAYARHAFYYEKAYGYNCLS